MEFAPWLIAAFGPAFLQVLLQFWLNALRIEVARYRIISPYREMGASCVLAHGAR